MAWIVIETIISLLEMLTSCFFAAGIFRKELREKRDIFLLVMYAAAGAALLTFREYVFSEIPDFAPAVVIFAVYAIVICHAKRWAALTWALMNYLLIGLASVTTSYFLEIVTDISVVEMEADRLSHILECILCRLGQLLFSELILLIMRKFSGSSAVRRGDWKVIAVSAVSIAVLWYVWMMRFRGDDNLTGYFIILICVLVLAVNLSLFLFGEIIARERQSETELRTQNRLMLLQARSQEEITNTYQNMLRLRHDMNNHLHTISGYIQIEEYIKAQKYIEEIVGDITRIESFHSGNIVIDALLGSKTALAKTNKISVKVDMDLLPDMKIEDEHLTVLIGNLYDNAIDANLKIDDCSRRFIHIKMAYINESLFLLFENAAQEEEKSDTADIWVTTKEDCALHGFGTRNIDRIVQMYEGYCERGIRNYVFFCRIRLPDLALNHKCK
ncbi:MAG: GHKL domain-containing protein [Lachnospiraceae bacterium]|nr:GHKL domain-containing protein [Lachnospiraceae bacterium]